MQCYIESWLYPGIEEKHACTLHHLIKTLAWGHNWFSDTLRNLHPSILGKAISTWKIICNSWCHSMQRYAFSYRQWRCVRKYNTSGRSMVGTDGSSCYSWNTKRHGHVMSASKSHSLLFDNDFQSTIYQNGTTIMTRKPEWILFHSSKWC